MQSVNMTELQNNLTHYLRQVRKGSELVIKDRNRIIARIVPATPHDNEDKELMELAAQGKVRLPELPVDEEFINETLHGKLPRMKTKGEAAKSILKRIMDEERGEY